MLSSSGVSLPLKKGTIISWRNVLLVFNYCFSEKLLKHSFEFEWKSSWIGLGDGFLFCSVYCLNHITYSLVCRISAEKLPKVLWSLFFVWCIAFLLLLLGLHLYILFSFIFIIMPLSFHPFGYIASKPLELPESGMLPSSDWEALIYIVPFSLSFPKTTVMWMWFQLMLLYKILFLIKIFILFIYYSFYFILELAH